MNASLAALVALQALDSAIDHARRRLSEMPAAEAALEATLAAATSGVEAAKAALAENQHARRQLEKDVAAVDARLARFDDHKAAVKTNQEYTALLHEIATAKSDKDALEEKILELMEQADALQGNLTGAQGAFTTASGEVKTGKAALSRERAAHDAELERLTAERATAAAGADARSRAQYEQLLKGRRGIAVAQMKDGHCQACHVRLRPHIAQQIRRNEELIQCESCQRILYYIPPPAAAEPDAPAAPPAS